MMMDIKAKILQFEVVRAQKLLLLGFSQIKLVVKIINLKIILWQLIMYLAKL